MKCTPREINDNEMPRLVSMVAFNGAALLDITGPLDVFAIANDLLQKDGRKISAYQTEIVAEEKDDVVITASGVRLLADTSWSSKVKRDTLLVAGGPMAEEASEDLVDWLRQTAPHVRRLGAICTGAFLLARAGLLDGRRATTHWCRAEKLQQRFPGISVEADCIYIKDGSVYTSAGITAGIDLALALVEEDFGRLLALNVARMMVLYLKRPGGQSQFSTGLLAQYGEGGVLAPTVQWMRDNYRRNLTNEVLAEQAAMSLRNFARVFKRETGLPPARFIEKIRLEAAVKLLEETRHALETIARECGFQSGEHFRLTFTRCFKITPGEYRDRFSSRTD
jgi:transcriptional regulator GlxA family with amidase domain